jgi:hypothetical protein
MKSGRVNVFFVDAQDRDLALSKPWFLHKKGYIARKDGRPHRGPGGKSTYLHRLIVGATKGEHVDHINGISWDNRRCNLRIVTRSENLCNRKGPASNGTSGYRGVNLRSRGGKKPWRAYAKGHHVGDFATALEAHKAVSAWRRQNMPTSQMDVA